jgi:hypothetical protein
MNLIPIPPYRLQGNDGSKKERRVLLETELKLGHKEMKQNE